MNQPGWEALAHESFDRAHAHVHGSAYAMLRIDKSMGMGMIMQVDETVALICAWSSAGKGMAMQADN